MSELDQGDRRDACRPRTVYAVGKFRPIVAEAFGKIIVPPELAEQVKIGHPSAARVAADRAAECTAALGFAVAAAAAEPDRAQRERRLHADLRQ